MPTNNIPITPEDTNYMAANFKHEQLEAMN